VPNSRKEAFELLEKLGTPEHIKNHVVLVGEVADLLIDALRDLGIELDNEFIRTGVVIHDVGKIVHINELTGPGSEHEPEGEKILIHNGVSEKLARVCMTHARWETMECSFEELIIALSDKLWKGQRVDSLELDVVDKAAKILKKERWDIFPELDLKFEEISSSGYERLQRSLGS
jgi:hypothetical protein